MKIYDEKTFFNFLNTVSKENSNLIFRGVTSDKYKLIPSIGRNLYKKGSNKKLDEKDEDLIFRFFKQRCKPFLHKEIDDMNLLAIGQHHGLPTRLLDWTFSPLVAAYFAVEKEIIQPRESERKIESSLIYTYDKKKKIIVDKSFENIKVEQLEFFIPNHNDDRIISQRGVLTVHPYPWNELNDSNIKTYTIDLSYRRKLRRLLNQLGINKSTIYPGLDGIAEHIKWMNTNFY